MLKRNLVRILAAGCIVGMLLYLVRDHFTPPGEGYEYVQSITIFNGELFVFMVVTSVGCIVFTHGFGRTFAIMTHLLGRGDATVAGVIEEDIRILAYISRTVMGVGRLGLLMGVVIALRNLWGCHHNPAATFAMALMPILYASALSTLVIAPAGETLRCRLEGLSHGS